MTLTALPAGMNVGARSKVSIISPVRGKAEQVRDQAATSTPMAKPAPRQPQAERGTVTGRSDDTVPSRAARPIETTSCLFPWKAVARKLSS
jgi:hypothetical protein